MFWPMPILAEQLARGLRDHEAELAAAAASHGLDALNEVELHSILRTELTRSYNVASEVHYPSGLGKRPERQRCDLVLTSPTLPLSPLWLEVKLAHQFSAPGERNHAYGAQWQRALTRDLGKLVRDPKIEHAALAFLVFTDGPERIAQDLATFETLLAARELLAGTRSTERVTIHDRLGHRLLTVALWPMLRAP